MSLFPEASRSTFIRGFLKYFALEDAEEEEEVEGGGKKKKKTRRERAPAVDVAVLESEQDIQDAAFKLLLVRLLSSPVNI